MENYFKFTENNTNLRTEIIAGVTTFLTMAYIIIIQPAILSSDFTGNPTGLGINEVFLATCIGSSLTCMIMGFYARWPIALSCGMGENFFFISVIMSLSAMGISHAWQVTLGMVFISGLVFFLLSLCKVTQVLTEAVPQSLKAAIAVGIGLFIAFIGFKNAGVIVDHPGTLVTLTKDFFTVNMLVFATGLFITVTLMVFKIRGALLLGIVAASVLALILGKIHFNGVVSLPDINKNAFLDLDIIGCLNITFIPFLLVFLVMDVFDTMGTLCAVAEHGGYVKDNKIPRADKVFVADASGSMISAFVGTSTITAFIESTTGIAEGGRTGLTSIVVGLLFLVALFFTPVITMLGSYAPITAPALIIVGAMMLKSARNIDFQDPSEYIPAFITLITIPLTFSIADGLALGFISFAAIKLISGKGNDVHWLMYIISLLLLAYFLFVRSLI
ncbi:MAG: NCS2 family permease [Nitrospinae bacterium]|nr:NCS2 family permease [Nitrospinota bacterium]